jgi:hypothetical protein
MDIKKYFTYILSVSLLILFPLFEVTLYPHYSILLLSGTIIFIILLLVYYFSNLSITSSLLLLCILPFVYLNDEITYSLEYTLLADIPILLFFFWFLINLFIKEEGFIVVKNNIIYPVVVLLVYTIFLAIMGILRGNGVVVALTELYHFFNYASIIPVLFLLKNQKDYKIVFNFLIIVSVFVSIEYIFLSINHNGRINSFQNAFFPLPFGLLISMILFYPQNKKKLIISIISLIFLISGAIVIKTRLLWVCLFITMTIVIYLYFSKFSKFKGIFKKYFILSLFIIIPFTIMTNFKGDSTIGNIPVGAEERLKSLSNPIADLSFLMRIEISYYAIRKFIESPLIGEGLGGKLRFKILGNEESVFIDNSWLYFLWKGGIVLFILIIWIFTTTFKNFFYLLKNSHDKFTISVTIASIASLISYIVYGLFSANLIAYKMTFFYGIIFAYSEFEKRKLENSN